MSIDSTGGANRHHVVQDNETVQDAEQIEEIKHQDKNREIQQSSIGKAEESKILNYLESSNPRLKPPNEELLAQQTKTSNLAAEDLTDEQILDKLNKFPQFQEFLSAQKIHAQESVVDHARQVMLGNSNDNMTLTSLAGKALSEMVDKTALLNDSAALKEISSDVKAELLFKNHPSSQVLVESLKNDFIAEGKSPEEAEKLAREKAVDMIQSKYSGNLTTVNPKIDKAIAALLADELGGTDKAKAFINNLNTLIGMEGKFVGLFEAMAKVKSEEASGDLGLENGKKIIKGANELIEEAMAQIDKVPIPGGQKTAMLDFMAAISAALTSLEKIMAEITMADAGRSKEEFSSKVDSILAGLRDTIAQLEKESKKAKKAGKKLGPLGDLGGVLDIFAPVMAAIMMVAIITAMVVIVVAASVLAIFTFGISLALAAILLPMLMLVLASMVVSLIVKEEGKTDNMMKILMTAVKELLKVMDIEASDQVVAAILAVAIITFMFMSMGTGASLGLQFLPEMIARTGVLGMVAEKFGNAVGMKEKEIIELEARLRLLTAMTSMGFQTSSTFENLTQEEQDDLIKGKRSITKLSLARSKERRVGAHAGAGQTQTLNDIARELATSPEELAKMQEELQQMIAILAKLVAQLKKLLAALIAGGSPAAMNDAIKSIEDLISGEMAKFVMPSGSELGVRTTDEESGESAALDRFLEESSTGDRSEFMPLLGTLTGNVLEALPYFYPSEETMKERLRDAREQADMFKDDDEGSARYHEIMG